MSTLALAMIVRDEAQRLASFLAHHRSLVDEIVVVDTGSRDDSVDLARAAGATVVHHRWDDDFASARNAGLAAVTAEQVKEVTARYFKAKNSTTVVLVPEGDQS